MGGLQLFQVPGGAGGLPANLVVETPPTGTGTTTIEQDGTAHFTGDATTWRDELGPLLGSRLESPGSDIVQNLAEVSITFKASARYPTDYLAYSLQINHDWLVQSVVEFHVHWWQEVAELANFLMGYRWQVNGLAKTTAWTLVPLSNPIFTYPGAPFTLNQISDGIGTITPPVGATLSDIFQVHFWRDYTNASGLFTGAETSGLDIETMSADMHRRSDTLGSRLEYAK